MTTKQDLFLTQRTEIENCQGTINIAQFQNNPGRIKRISMESCDTFRGVVDPSVYKKWDKFLNVILETKQACANSGQIIDSCVKSDI